MNLSKLTSLRLSLKTLAWATLFLIFAGGLVKSTESGLSVPDWPLSYGTFFPPMVGGVFYEHGHRMIATGIGLFTLILSIWIWRSSNIAKWVKYTILAGLGSVILQGVLGGLTVLFFLPVSISSAHGILAQTFFLITIFLAYAFSVERNGRLSQDNPTDGKFIRFIIIFIIMVYIQLLLGNLMRHTESGLAVYDFPTMGGQIIPMFNAAMLNNINAWRFEHNLDPVTMGQVHLHILHRIWGFLILAKLLFINFWAYKYCLTRPLVIKTLFLLNAAVILQIALGIGTVLSMKEVYTTTLHVTLGAGVLGLSFLLLLRASPLRWAAFKTSIQSRA